MDPLFITLENVSVELAGQPLLKNLSWSWQQGQQWAITGDSGSGKTLLARVLAGRQHYQGTIRTAFGDADQFAAQVYLVEQQHRFRDHTNRGDFYYQQRYQSFDASATATVREELAPYPAHAGLPQKADLIERLQLQSLLDEPMIQLSNGETNACRSQKRC